MVKGFLLAEEAAGPRQIGEVLDGTPAAQKARIKAVCKTLIDRERAAKLAEADALTSQSLEAVGE